MTDGPKGGKGQLSRKEFLKMGAAGLVLGPAMACSKAEKSGNGKETLSRRKMGKTDIMVSAICMGGGSALGMVKSDKEAIELIELAYRRGINFFDSSANYGKSEGRFGTALSPVRKEVYFSTKYEPEDSPDELMKKVERSLKRFRTDYLDVAHIHSLKNMDEVDMMFRTGALETLVKLKEQGVVRYIGVTSHNHPPAMKAALERFDFDVCFQAANASRTPFIFEFEELPDTSFEELSLPVALKKDVGVLAFKITGQRRLIGKNEEPDKASGLELIRYGLSLPSQGILLGMSTPEHVNSAVDLALDFEPMTAEEMRGINSRLAPSANDLTLHYLRPEYVDDGGWRSHLV